MLPLLCACVGVLAHLPPASVSASLDGQTPRRLAIRAHHVHTGEGATIENGIVLIEGAKIAAVGTGVAIPADVVVIEHAGDISAGCIALHDESGGDGELVDSTRVELAESRAARALDSAHSDFGRLVAEGITSVVLGGSDEVLCGGQTAVVKTVGGVIVRDPAHLELSLSADALNFGRFPTSYGGAVAELDARMSEGKGVFGMAHRGELPVLLAANEKHEVLRALEFAQRYGLKGALLGAPLAGELVEQVKASGLAVIWRPFDSNSTQRELDALVALSRAGIPFGFALDAPARHPAALRMSAAASVRAGVDREIAFRALTSTAAAIAGVSDRLGRLAPGLDADLVLWSGDPLDLTSSIAAVFIDGRLVSGALVHGGVPIVPPALAALSSAASAGAPAPQESASLTIFAERLYLAPGKVVENGILHFSGEKFAAIEGREPANGEEGLRVKAVTAGMIDASVRITNGLASVEQVTEVQPARRVADSLDPFDPRWKRVLASGITTALVTPEGYDVIGGLGVVLKTGGADTIAGRTMKADAVLCGAIGSMPSAFNSPAGGPPEDFFARRPTTRMGVEWEWRKALYDAAASTRLPERAFPGSEVLVRALRGELPLCIEAWTTQDIRTAVFLDEEMTREKLGDLHLIVDCAAEAWKEPQLLVRTGAAVILPPFESGGRTGPERPGAFLAWNVAKELHDMGVLVALSSHGAANVADRLALQAGYAMRGGMSFDEALAAVTVNPARILGVEDRVGSIGTGMDADLVLWNGTPFEPTSRIVGVVLNGKLVVDPRR